MTELADDTAEQKADANLSQPTPEATVDPFADILKADQENRKPVSLGQRFGLNVTGGYREGTILGAGGLYALKRDAESGDPESMRRYEDAVSSLTKYKATPSFQGPLEGIISLAGQIGGSLGSPESFVARVPGVSSVLEKIGLTGATVAGRVAEQAASQGVVNAATDPVVQALQIGSGQKEGYDPYQTALALPLGVAVGGTLAGAGEIAGGLARRGARRATEAEVRPEADVTPPAEAASEKPAAADSKAEPPVSSNPEVVEARVAEAPEVSTEAEARSVQDGAKVATKTSDRGDAISEAAPSRESVPTGKTEPAVRENVSVKEAPRPAIEPEAPKVEAGKAAPASESLPAQQGDIQFRRKGREGSGVPEVPQAASGGEVARPILSPQEQASKLADELNFTFRQGRVSGGKDSLGQFDTKQGIGRVRSVADVGTVMHEAAHFIEADGGQGLSDLIQKRAGELGKLDYDQTRLDPREGFAEFLRQWVEAPAAADRAAPEFSKDFRELMASENPALIKALDDAQQRYADYQASPSDAKVAALVKNSEPEGILKSLKENGFPQTVRTVVSRFYETIFDDKAPVTMAVRDMARMIRDATGELPKLEGGDNPEVLVRLFGRAHQAAVQDLRYGVTPYRRIVPEGPALADALTKAIGGAGPLGHWNSARVEEFGHYLVLRRAAVLYDKLNAGELDRRPLAMTEGDVRQGLADFEAANPTFREASQMVHDYTRELLKKQFDGGLIERELFDNLKNEAFYVPFYRDMSDKPLTAEKPTSGAPRSEGPGKADLVKRIKGSDRDIMNPIQSIMTQTFLVNRTVAHNEVIRSFVNLARQAQKAGAVGVGRIVEEIPAHQIVGKRFDLAEAISGAAREHGIDKTDLQVLTGALADTFGEDPIMAPIFRHEPTGKRGEPIVFWKEGGELRAVRLIADKEGRGLYEALTELPTQMQDSGLKILSTASGLLRTGIVTNPTFAFTNYIRDQFAASILRPDYIPFNPRGLVREVAQDQYARLYAYAGGVSPGAGAHGLSELIEGGIDAMSRKGWAVQKLGSLADVVRHGDVREGLKALGEVVEVSEAGTRLNVFKQVFEQKKAQGLTDWDAMMEAAYQSTDLMDFGRHGSRTNALRSLVPFLNAHMQGLDKARRTLLVPLIRQATGDIVTEAEKAAVTNAGLALAKTFGVGGALGLAYGAMMANHPAYRDANSEMRATHLIIPGDAIGKPGKVVLIPKPFELAIGFNLGEMLGISMATGDPRTAQWALTGIQEVIQPPNVLESIPLLKTWAELKLNRSFFTQRDIVPESLQKLSPGEQVRTNTSAVSRSIGEAIGVSPIKVDYAIGSFFGTNGRDLLTLSNVTDPDAPAAALEDQMFFRRFIKGADTASETTKRFWEIAGQRNGQFAQAKNTYEDMLTRFKDDGAQRYLSALPAAQRAYVIMNSAADEDGKLRFSIDERRMQPLTRAATAIRTINGYISELQRNAQRDIETGQKVDMSPTDRRDLISNMRQLAAMEQRNALVILKDPGYADRGIISVDDQFNTIKAIDPAVATELANRYATAKVYPTEAVAKAWPEMQSRLLRDGGQADIGDLAIEISGDGYQFGGERVRKAPKRRVEIAPPALSAPAQQPASTSSFAIPPGRTPPVSPSAPVRSGVEANPTLPQ